MVHLSVAIGRFFEALLYAIFSIAALAALEMLAGLGALAILVMLARKVPRRKRRP